MTTTIINKNILFIITGASRGFGRAMTIAFHRYWLQQQRQQQQQQQQQQPTTTNLSSSSSSSSSLSNDSNLCIHTILIARTKDDCYETKSLLEQEYINYNNNNNNKNNNNIQNTTFIYNMDLSDLSQLDYHWDCIYHHHIEQQQQKQQQFFNYYNEIIFLNNAGSLGTIGPCYSNNHTLSNIQQTMNFNITSNIWSSIRFIRYVIQQQQKQQQQLQLQQQQQNLQQPIEAILVNISSLTAIQPFPSMGLYSAGKAARDMYHACMSMELESLLSSWSSLQQNNKMNDKNQDNNSNNNNKNNNNNNDDDHDDHDDDNNNKDDNDDRDKNNNKLKSIVVPPNIKILNYAPGPLENTNMTKEIRASNELDTSLQPHYHNTTLVHDMDSANALVELVLITKDYENGSHVDYYDQINKKQKL